MTTPAQQRADRLATEEAGRVAAARMQHEQHQREVDAARLWRLANPDHLEKRARMATNGRWSKLAEQAAEKQTSIAEQRRTEEAAAAADKAEAAWVSIQASQRQQRDRERADQAGEAAKAVLKQIHELRAEAKDRRVSPEDVASRLRKLRSEQDKLAALAENLAASVESTKAMREDPHAYLADFLRRFPSLNTGQPIEDPGGTAPAAGAALPVNVDRVASLLESVREAFVEAEDEYLAVSDRQRRLASLAGNDDAALRAKYPAIN